MDSGAVDKLEKEGTQHRVSGLVGNQSINGRQRLWVKCSMNSRWLITLTIKAWLISLLPPGELTCIDRRILNGTSGGGGACTSGVLMVWWRGWLGGAPMAC